MLKIKEKILIGRIRKQDRNAFEEIYDEYSEQIHRFLYFRAPTAECDDLLQEVFLDLWGYLSDREQKQVENLKALIYKIAKNKVANYFGEREKEKRLAELGEITAEEEAKLALVPDGELDLQADIQKIKKEMEGLENELYREILEMRFVDELSHKEIAEIIEKDAGTTRVLLHRALKQVKERVGKSE